MPFPSSSSNSPLATVRKQAVNGCYEGILKIVNNFENMQIHYRKYSDPDWQKVICHLLDALETLQKISQSKLD